MHVDPELLVRLAGALLQQQQEHRELTRHRFDWRAIARPAQLAPGTPGSFSARRDWDVWFLMAGRGFGKTRSGAEWVREQVAEGRRRRLAFIAPTLRDARRIMVEGPSGILSVSTPAERPEWFESKGELHWPNGAVGYIYTSEEPERLRGPEHDGVWCEELGAWRNAQATWDQMEFGLRIAGPQGDAPQAIVTSTPRPTPLVRKIVADRGTVVSHGTTYENQANLSRRFLGRVLKYEGTRLGEQELKGKLLGDTPGAMFKREAIEKSRVVQAPTDMEVLVLAIDPQIADADARRKAEADQTYLAETGLILAGRARCLCKNTDARHGFVIADLSGYYQPEEWATLALGTYESQKVDRIVAEVNNGGALVEANLRAQAGGRRFSYKAVTASRGKAIRAEPIATLYEKLEIHHVGEHPALEDQLTTWNPLLTAKSPDRLDANVWALTELMLEPAAPLYSSLPHVSSPRRI